MLACLTVDANRQSTSNSLKIASTINLTKLCVGWFLRHHVHAYCVLVNYVLVKKTNKCVKAVNSRPDILAKLTPANTAK